MSSVAPRDYYGKALVELGHTNPNIFVLDADLSSSTKTGLFAKAFPDRFFNAGIAEQNCIGMAAGLANMGKTVFASSFAMFISGRTWEQIRNTVAYTNLNVKVVATHAGVTVGEDGGTHQAIEDIAIMRAIPLIKVLVPADAIEAAQMVHTIAAEYGPVYMRMSRGASPLVYEGSDYQFKMGKSHVLRNGSDVTIVACGIMVDVAMRAAQQLSLEHINARVINLSSIKPIDEDVLVKAAKETGAIVTAEEHSVIGGMGSAVAEVIVKKMPVPMEMLGIEGVFGESGKPDQLLDKHHLNVDGLVAKVKSVLLRKSR